MGVSWLILSGINKPCPLTFLDSYVSRYRLEDVSIRYAETAAKQDVSECKIPGREDTQPVKNGKSFARALYAELEQI